MALPAYSSTGLPYSHLVDSWSMPKPYQDPTESDFDGGNKRLRRQPGDEAYLIQFDLMFTSAQFGTFKTWVNTFKGIGHFMMNVYDGATVAVREVQFEKPYVPTAVPPGNMQVTFQLRVFP